MEMKVRITDLETDAATVYDLSKLNWKRNWAAMQDGRVIMWIPGKAQPPFKMVTSGRRWESFKEENEMEIPTNKINNELDNLADTLIADESQPASRIKTVIDAMDVIKAQALEIEELQAVIVRLRDNLSMSDRDYLELIERHSNG